MSVSPWSPCDSAFQSHCQKPSGGSQGLPFPPHVLLAAAGHSISLTFITSLLLKPTEAFSVLLWSGENCPRGVASECQLLWRPCLATLPGMVTTSHTHTGTRLSQPLPAFPSIARAGDIQMTRGHSVISGLLSTIAVTIRIISAAVSVRNLQAPCDHAVLTTFYCHYGFCPCHPTLWSRKPTLREVKGQGHSDNKSGPSSMSLQHHNQWDRLSVSEDASPGPTIPILSPCPAHCLGAKMLPPGPGAT